MSATTSGACAIPHAVVPTKLATNAQETRNVVAPIQDALGRIGTIQAELYIYSN